MSKKKIPKTRKVKSSKPASTDDTSTIIWGERLEEGDFIKVPRCLLRLGRYKPELMKKLQPRHLLLILNLAGRKFQNKEIRVYWEALAEDLGVSKDTVRKWGYELRDMGLITIRQHRGRDKEHSEPGWRNDRNGFCIDLFVKEIQSAFTIRQRERNLKNREMGGEK